MTLCPFQRPATVYEAIAQMAEREVGALWVLPDRNLVGLVSERDYARKVILQGGSSKETRVQEIMTPSPITVTSAHSVDEWIRIITNNRIRHLSVMDEGELKGIVSIGDLGEHKIPGARAVFSLVGIWEIICAC